MTAPLGEGASDAQPALVIPDFLVAIGVTSEFATFNGIATTEALRGLWIGYNLGIAAGKQQVEVVLGRPTEEPEPAKTEIKLPERLSERLQFFPGQLDVVRKTGSEVMCNPQGAAAFERIEGQGNSLPDVSKEMNDTRLVEEGRLLGSRLETREVVAIVGIPDGNTFATYTGETPVGDIADGQPVIIDYLMRAIDAEYLRLNLVVPISVAKEVMRGLTGNPRLLRETMAQFITDRIAEASDGTSEREQLMHLNRWFLKLGQYFDEDRATHKSTGVLIRNFPGTEDVTHTQKFSKDSK